MERGLLAVLPVPGFNLALVGIDLLLVGFALVIVGFALILVDFDLVKPGQPTFDTLKVTNYIFIPAVMRRYSITFGNVVK